jgi:hypothetical protein
MPCVIIDQASDSRYPEGLNSLPAEVEVNPVFAGTGIFVINFLSNDEKELKRGRIC